MINALNVQASAENNHLPPIKDATEKGITKQAIKMSLIVKKRIEILVVVRKLGFLQMIKQVDTFPMNAESINTTSITDPVIISSAVKYSMAFVSLPSAERFPVIFMIGIITPIRTVMTKFDTKLQERNNSGFSKLFKSTD